MGDCDQVSTVPDAAEAARHERLSAGLRPLPAGWALGEPRRVGDKVAFTGCDWQVRERLERHAERLGVRVMNNVPSRTALLVTDSSYAGGKADDAAARGTRCVHPEEFAILLTYLQPATKRTTAVPRPRPVAPMHLAAAPASRPAADAGTLPAAHGTASPAAVRTWARANGHEVGDRGRLPAEITDAHRRAHEAVGQA